MSRIVMKSAVAMLAVFLGVVSAPATATGQCVQSPLVPPWSHAFGKSFEEWNVLYSRWAIESGLGGGTDLRGKVGRVRFLPTEFSNAPSVTFDVTLPPGTPFVSPPFFVFGERYDDPSVPDDNPTDPILDFIFETAEIRTVLDGRVLLNGSDTELHRFFFGPVYFDEPIVYEHPQPRGEALNSTAALFALGIGSVYHPLPVGRHTLIYTRRSAFFGDKKVTYRIKVSPR